MPEVAELMPPSLEEWRGKNPEKTIAVMMSGGVDSSVTASLLIDQGWDVVGVTMKIPNIDPDIPKMCCGEEAVFVCKKIGIPHYFINSEELFKKHVICHFRETYLAGKTPNPCAECNRKMKFGILWDTVEKELGIKIFATGHYAKIIRQGDKVYLARGSDIKRDQSYFIYGIKREKLPYFHLPLGDIEKTEVRKIAGQKDLHIANRPDSMDLCFAGEGDYRELIGGNYASENGPVYDMQGNVMAEHAGIWNYTIGQRRGLGFAAGEPRYVLAINIADNSITVGTRAEAYRRNFNISNPNILIPEEFVEGAEMRVKIRSLSGLKPCTVKTISDFATISFEEPQFAPTPGQHAVLYDQSDKVVAGGEIESAF